jgi:tyrosine-protein kinase Etk/Wzc
MQAPDPGAPRPSPSAGAVAQRPGPAVRRNAPSRPPRAEPDDPTLADVAWTLAERRWTIAAVACAALLAGAAYLFLAPPVYESSVLVQVEGRARPATPEDVRQLFDTSPSVEAEMRILRSRMLLERVVDELGLDIEARPQRVPLVGAALARRHRGPPIAGVPLGLDRLASRLPLGLDRFAWGGERLRVDRLEVSSGLIDEPVRLVALEDGAYQLKSRDGEVLAKGRVGVPATPGEGDRRASLLVSDLSARPGTEFTLRKLRRDDVIQEFQKTLRVSEQGNHSGLVEVTLQGSDAARVARILEALSAAYVRQSVERTSAEAESMMRALEGQLPPLKSSLDAAESALDRFHQRNGAVNLSLEAQRLILEFGEIDKALAEAEAGELEQARRHTGQYPEVSAPTERAEKLRGRRAGIEAEMRALPGLEVEYARLARQASVATERYTRALDRTRELRTVKSGWIGNALVLEHAVEHRRPVSPNKGLVLALAMILGLTGGIAAALVRSGFDEGIRDPDEIESHTGLPVFATIPRSAAQRRIVRRGRRRARLEVLSVADPGDEAVEELRALRTGVEFALQRATNNVVAVGSAAPRAGKSFVSVNLAHLLAAAHGRVLLVDGDLRRGMLHRYFGLTAEPGISDVVRGEATLDQAVRPTEHASLDLLPAGARVPNPAELLAGAPFGQLLEQVRGRYDIIVVDTPPILSVTDSALVGRYAGVNLLVVRVREQTVSEVALAVTRLVRNGITVRGAVLNDVQPTLGRYGASGRYRRYDTRSP